MDLPKAYNNVYGIGPGTRLDAEILVYMKSQGWPERVQVGGIELIWAVKIRYISGVLGTQIGGMGWV